MARNLFIFVIFAPYLERVLFGDKVSLIYSYALLWDLNTDFFMPTAKYEIKRKCKCCGATFLAKSLDSNFVAGHVLTRAISNGVLFSSSEKNGITSNREDCIHS